jgi:hypothetical protein
MDKNNQWKRITSNGEIVDALISHIVEILKAFVLLVGIVVVDLLVAHPELVAGVQRYCETGENGKDNEGSACEKPLPAHLWLFLVENLLV